jgi:hypothetical protein
VTTSSTDGAPTQADLDRQASSYDPASNKYRLADDPRCLWGWGPPTRGCHHMFGHGCFRAFGHPGRCHDAGNPPRDKCESAQRPKNWDDVGRAEANR